MEECADFLEEDDNFALLHPLFKPQPILQITENITTQDKAQLWLKFLFLVMQMHSSPFMFCSKEIANISIIDGMRACNGNLNLLSSISLVRVQRMTPMHG